MFTKKPLGGMSCASCEKNIINLHGVKADYTPWNRFPFRDPSERIAKVITFRPLLFSFIGGARLLEDAVDDQPRLHDAL